MKKVAFYTLGCKLNFAETSSISRMFSDRGYEKVDFQDNPDIFIINTCSVTENADKKCRKVVQQAKKISPRSYVAIVGCYAQLKPKEISEIPGVNSVLGAAEKFQLFDYLGSFEPKETTEIYHQDIKEATNFHHSHSFGDRTRTFLKVQDGCNYGCSFCTIPLARGKSRSDSISNIIEEAQRIASSGVKEVVLTGVNIGDFGIQEGRRKEKFIDLICALDKVSGLDRFRISSIEPNLLSNEIIEFVSKSDRFVPHFHIPLQSGSDKILESMNRRYRRDLYTSRINKIKEVMPDCCIGVDVIAGFPGETDSDFQETYEFLLNLPVSYLHAFTYSERQNTTAANMSDSVPISVRQERSRMLRNLSDKKRRHFYERQLGKEWIVLFEEDIENGYIHGFTENYVRVRAKYDPILVNELRPVRLTSIAPENVVDVEEPEMMTA